MRRIRIGRFAMGTLAVTHMRMRTIITRICIRANVVQAYMRMRRIRTHTISDT